VPPACWDSWLLVGWDASSEPAGGRVKEFLADLGALNDVDLGPRPRAALAVVGGTVHLITPDPAKIFDASAASDRGRLAFALSEVGDLQRLHEKKFRHRGNWFQITWEGNNSDTTLGPYFRRFVRIRFFSDQPLDGARITPGTETECVRRDPTAEELERGGLILDPGRVTFSPDQTTIAGAPFVPYWLQDAGAPLRESSAVLLPPTRGQDQGRIIPDEGDAWSASVPRESYFSKAAGTMRLDLAKVLGIESPTAHEAAMVSLWRVTNDPLVRDVLFEGGAVELVASNGEPTRWRIRVAGRDREIGRYRHAIFVTPRDYGGKEWAAKFGPVVATRIAADSSLIAPNGLPPMAADNVLQWSRTRARSYQARDAPPEGFWQVFVEIENRIRQGGSSAGEFHKLITEPSGPVSAENAPPDHDLAELLFMKEVWRCPWADDLPTEWRRALEEILPDLTGASMRSLDASVGTWADARASANVRSTGPEAVGHSFTVEAQAVKTWRLIAPLGTVFREDRTIVLNDAVRGRLDRGFVLG
jgi:hypothetical protein